MYSINVSSVVSSLILITISFYYCIKDKIFIYDSFKNIKIRFITKTHIFPALEQLLDNMAYIFVILASLNLMHQNSEYFIAMFYFWGFILVFILSFGSIIQKIIVKKDEICFKNKLIFILSINIFFIFLVIISYFYIQQIATFIGLNLNNQSLSIIKSLYFAYVIFHLSYSIKCIFMLQVVLKKHF